MAYTYEYPHPAVTTDVVIFTVISNSLHVLLVERGEEPFKGSWAIPGGFLQMDESLDECANRELHEETSLNGVYLEQLGTFGGVNRDPRERVISVAYYALVPSDDIKLKAGSDAQSAKWCDVAVLPKLAFDHGGILKVAQERLSAKMDYSTIGLQFMPNEFTLTDLQQIYEVASGKALDKRNFRKWILGLGLIEETGGKRADGAYRPAKLYRVIDKGRVEIVK